MVISEMQEAREEPPAVLDDWIASVTRQWKEGNIGEASYHSQLSILYAGYKMVDECRYHAELVPDTASENDNSEAFVSLARILVYENKVDEAISLYEKALQADPTHDTATGNDHYYEYMLGLCYSHLGDFYRALAHYTKSLDAKPSFGHALNNMATLYFEHEADIKTAIGYLQKAEAIAEDEEDVQLLQLVCINLVRLYGW